jgi:hypothetical protein
MRTGRNIRRFSFPLLPLAFCLLLASCYNYDQEVTLNRDGSGTLRVRIEMEPFTFPGEPEPDVGRSERQPCRTPTMGFEEISGVELSSCEEWIEDFRIHEEALYSFNRVDLLSTRGWSYSWEREGAYKVLRVSFDTEEDAPAKEDKAGALEEMAGFRGAHFTVTLPKEIAGAPGAVVSGNTAEWDFRWEDVIDQGLTRIDMEARVKLNFFQRVFGW